MLKRRLFCLTLALVLLNPFPLLAAGPGAQGTEAQPKIDLYVTDWCGYCKRAEAFFTARGLSFNRFDVEKDQLAAVQREKFPGRGVPYAVINGTGILGYSEAEYFQALRSKK